MIRRATPDDLQQVVELGEAFHAATIWKDLAPFDRDSFEASVEALLDRDDAAIFLSPGGFIGLTKVGLYFNRAVPVTAELFFWAPDGQGDALRKAAERWAGGLLVMNAHLAEPRAANWYARKGYRPLEATFLKVT